MPACATQKCGWPIWRSEPIIGKIYTVPDNAETVNSNRSKYLNSPGIAAVNSAGRKGGTGRTGGTGRRAGPGQRSALAGRLAVLRAADFRRFYVGYSVSWLGTSMSNVAVTFAVLDSGGNAADLGSVFAAQVVPQVLLMLGGGVVADRFGRRAVMLAGDAARLAAQACLAAVLFAGRPPIWLFVVLAALLGSGEAFFTPALGGLTVEIAPREFLSDANALLGLAQSVTSVLGPALAGVLISVTSPAPVVAIDAGSYGVSALALSLLRVPATAAGRGSPLRDLAEGWAVFRSQSWLWLTTAQFALFNLFTWAPYLLLGPVLARDYLGGVRAWGTIVAAYAAGSILAGAAIVGRRPRRLLTVSTLASFGYPLPCLLLALHAGVWLVAAGALAAGAGSTVCGTFWSTALQQRVEPEALARAKAFSLTGSFALGSAGFAIIGPVAAVVGARGMLAFAAAWGFAGSIVALALPAIRSVTWLD
jgi:Major Facilitator Superfamily